jgi:hypothetical protein
LGSLAKNAVAFNFRISRSILSVAFLARSLASSLTAWRLGELSEGPDAPSQLARGLGRHVQLPCRLGGSHRPEERSDVRALPSWVASAAPTYSQGQVAAAAARPRNDAEISGEGETVAERLKPERLTPSSRRRRTVSAFFCH